MNDKDKQEFLKWIVTKLTEEDQDYIKKGEISPYFKPSYKNGKPDINEAWQAACEYMRNKSNPLDALSLYEKLETERAENKKLRETLENIKTK